MKPRQVKKLLRIMVLGACLSPWVVGYAAQQEMIWGKVDDYTALLKNYTLTETVSIPKNLRLPPHSLSAQKNSVNTFQFLAGQVDHSQKSHVRYDQYYQGVPVWTSQVIYHVSSPKDVSITGSIVTGIEQDVPSLTAKISVEQAKKIAIGKNSVKAPVNVEKIIYFDEDVSNKALLAYHISYLSSTEKGPAIPTFIIDANSGKILSQGDALPRAEIGQGSGGVSVEGRLKYRSGRFQYGTTMFGYNALGMLEVQYAQNSCTISNNLFSVINLQNRTEGQLAFSLPISSANERRYNIQAFKYACTPPTYININDGATAPINDGLSPINDVTFFVNETFKMLMNQYQVPTPVGNQLPVRIFTHVANLDNAFACGPTCLRKSGMVGPQQITFGNGDATHDSPLTDGDGIAHEFGHLVTEHFSNLHYDRPQSGGMNEAFSDILGVAMLDYVRNTLGYSWYWDGLDYTTGASISKTGTPMRYYYDPTLDGSSIGNFKDFRSNMDVHNSSGLYNKMFYLLSAKTTGWTVKKAFQVVMDANMHYWTPGSTFKSGGCGILQATRARGYSEQDVKNVFQQIGIDLSSCRRI